MNTMPPNVARDFLLSQREYDENLDTDTNWKGTKAPFEVWEGDHTAFVHVLWDAKSRPWTLTENADEIASAIRRSRALAAYTAFARSDALLDAAKAVAAMGETVGRDDVVALLGRLAEAEVTGATEPSPGE